MGAYQTKFGELWDKSLSDLMGEAGRGAVEDAGITMKQIKAVYVGSMLAPMVSGQNHMGAMAAQALGISVPAIAIDAACASGGVAVAQGLLAIKSGAYDTVLVVGVEKMTDVESDKIAESLMGAAASEEERRSGITFPGLYAMMARAYMDEFGLTREELARVPVRNHWHGSLNPLAHLAFCVTEDQVLGSGMVADPLRLLDCAPISDGAAAIVLSTQKQTHPGVKLIGSGQASDSVSLTRRQSLVEIKVTRLAAEAALRQAGVTRREVGVVEVHDCFSIAEVMAVEDLGFCKKGEGVKWLTDNGRLGQKVVVNTSGGLKACGHPVGATGVKQIVEITNQLRGRAGQRQVKGAKVGLTHNVGGSGGTAVVHVLSI